VNDVKKHLFPIFVTAMLIVIAPLATAQEKIYSIWLRVFRNDTVILEGFSIEEGLQTHFPTTQTGYYLEVVSYENEVLFRANVGISFSIHILTTEIPSNITEFELDEILINLRLPFFENAKEINLYHGNKKIFSIQLSNYICNNNGLCEKEKGETPINCPNDCLTTTTTTLPPAKPTLPFHYFAIIFVFIAAILFFLLTRIKVQRSESPS